MFFSLKEDNRLLFKNMFIDSSGGMFSCRTLLESNVIAYRPFLFVCDFALIFLLHTDQVITFFWYIKLERRMKYA